MRVEDGKEARTGTDAVKQLRILGGTRREFKGSQARHPAPSVQFPLSIQSKSVEYSSWPTSAMIALGPRESESNLWNSGHPEFFFLKKGISLKVICT